MLRLGALALVALASAAPTGDDVKKPCEDGVLYKEVLEDICPSKFHIGVDGDDPAMCENADRAEYFWCSSFCQVRTTFVYGPEIPFVGTLCEGPKTCSIDSQETVTLKYPRGDALEDAVLHDSVTGGWRWPEEIEGIYGEPGGHKEQLGKGECGYYTFLRMLPSGTWSHGERLNRTSCGPITNDGNSCHRRPVLRDGKLAGRSEFIRVDCATRMPLENQLISQYPDVALAGGLNSVPGVADWNHLECKAQYSALYEGFLMSGKDWPKSWLGLDGDEVDGHKIFAAFRHCGAPTLWNFDYHPESNSWKAWGDLPVFTKKCVGDALHAAGGVGYGECWGPG